MKKTATFLFLCLLTLVLPAQSLIGTNANIKKDLTWTRTFTTVNRGLGKTASCGPDTVTYPYGKATQIQAVAMNSANASMFMQYYPAPQSISVAGFDFYAWQSAGTSAVVSITCAVYAATMDSLPNGAPLRTVTVQVDSSFGSGSLATLLKSAVFSSPVSFNGGGYVLTVETNSTTSVSIATNSYNYGDGGGVFASSVKLYSVNYRSYDINVGGIPFDADFMLHPYVTYNLTANFTVSACNTGGNTITFTNTSSPVLFNSFYNFYALYNIAYVGMRWDYGDSSGTYYQQNGSHSYTYRANHDVTLRDTIYAWRRGCIDVVTRPSYAAPAPPGVTNNGPICAGDTLKLNADSINGAVYSWVGPNFNSTKRTHIIPKALNTQAGAYQVRIVQNTCTSAYNSTNVVIYPKPQRPDATNNGPKCVGDSVTFNVSNSSGLDHLWSGPKNFSSTDVSPGIGNVDSSHSGKYIVVVSDPNCSSDPDTTELTVYPPPAPPLLSTFGNDTLCEGDTLKLKGGSVPGAIFLWTGPDNFYSSATHPSRLWVQTIHSGYYKTAVKIGSCASSPDSIFILVNPLPVTSAISGPDTSTEALIKTYSVSNTSGSTYNWTASGGSIQSGNGTNSITVLWGTPGSGKVTVTETSSSGCKDTAREMTVQITAKPDPESVLKFKNGAMVRMYPNPAAGKLNLSFDLPASSAVQVRIYDVLGKLMLDRSLQLNNTGHIESFELATMPKGVYLLQVQLNNSQQTMRLVLE